MVLYPSFQEVEQAFERIRPRIHQTPVLTCQNLNELTQASLFFKCENFQKVGAFKFRGACNAVFSLSAEESKLGVATHSSGNHAQALALAAKLRGIPAYIVMPDNAPEVKKNAVVHYGGQITFCSPTLEARESTLAQVVQQTGAVPIHPYNHPLIIAGQGTVALELLQIGQSFDIIMTPVGGGGLLSGTALTVSHLSPETQIFGAEPEQANDAYQSFKSGKWVSANNPKTIADGLKTSLGDLTFPLIQRHVHDILCVSEKNILEAMRLIWERMKVLIEPSAAVPLGAVLQHPKRFENKRVGLVLSGGNVDFTQFSWPN